MSKRSNISVRFCWSLLLTRNLVCRTNSVSSNVSFVTHHSNYELCTLALSEVCAPRNSPGSMLSSSSKNRWNRNVTGRVVFS